MQVLDVISILTWTIDTSNENEPNLENPPQQNQNQNQDQDQENNKDADSSSPNNDDRPPPGSEEWHRQRRESHKLVERRRRETINEGISVLGRLVPNCEKNKGQILQRAAEYIQHLKRLDAANAEKWTLEKLLLNQALDQLHGQVQDLKSQLEAVQRENDLLKEQLNHRERDSVSLKRDHDQEDDEKSRKSLKKEA